MLKATEVFNQWAQVGKDKGMEQNHAKSVEDMLNFALRERYSIEKKFNFLDLGCGNGWVVQRIAKEQLCYESTGIDGADHMIKNAKKKDPVSEYILTDINSYQPKKKFDLIHSMEVLYYLDDPKRIIKNIYNSLMKINGRLIIGIDLYFENQDSHTWEERVGTKMKMLKESEWISFFELAGFKEIKSWRSNKQKDWAGTLVITGKK
tara:strand:- start:308 stop:925 length:618 start_codon:yes stop_codon:yes gene_type:complete